jgi:prolyl 4-hydroxylase
MIFAGIPKLFLPYGYFLLFISSNWFVPVAFGDVFTAMVDLENLLINEAATTTTVIDAYIESEMERLRKLQEFAESYLYMRENPGKIGMDLIDEKSVMNPINAYLLIKRLTNDWKTVNFYKA